jgi:hypothetical protein
MLDHVAIRVSDRVASGRFYDLRPLDDRGRVEEFRLAQAHGIGAGLRDDGAPGPRPRPRVRDKVIRGDGVC